MKNKKKGFTLVELLVVIAILAVLASVSVVGYMGFTAKAKESKCLQEAKQVQTCVLAELSDGKSTNYTFVNGDLNYVDGVTTNPTDLHAEFNIDGLKGTLTADVATDKLTYELDGYIATINLKLNTIEVAKVTKTAA